MNKIILTLGPRLPIIPLLLSLGISPAYAEEFSEEYMANPFAPATEVGGKTTATDASVSESLPGAHPLQQSHVKSYTLLAVIVSANWSVALVRSSGGQEFYVHEGDKLGNKDGAVTAIFDGGLEVEEAQEITILNVKNRSISFEKEAS